MLLNSSKRLREVLLEKALVTSEQLEAGLKQENETGEFLITALLKLGFAERDEMYSALSGHLGVEYVKLKYSKIEPDVIEKVPAKVACHYKLMPVRIDNDTITVAVLDPLNLFVLDEIKLFLGLNVNLAISSEEDIMDAIKEYYGVGAETIERLIEADVEKEVPVVTAEEGLEEGGDEASIVKFVNQIFLQAVHDRATDIHIEPFEDEVKVRYRIDGVLYDTYVPPEIKYFQAAIVSRIKVMATLNIAEKRLPQDGRIKVRVGGNDLDMRVSILPTAFGESVNIRLLSSNVLLGLKTLGLASENLAILEDIIKKPHGIIFLTGPTGSGKTTTLYACLSKINSSNIKIITIEDPIEYQLKGISQIQVTPKIGLTFANGLRSMLRHDPDVMMVGEVRDQETADIAIRVALTGHLVFSTLHTNDAAGGITRLIDMNVEPFLVASCVECIIAQRLVRTICPECKELVPKERVKELLKGLTSGDELKGAEIYEGKGCEACKGTGFRGRIGLHEFLVMSDPVKDMVLEKVSSTDIKKKAVSLGMRTLREEGWEKVQQGLTTIGEVLRVTQEEEQE